VRITYDPEANAAYIRLTDVTASGHHSTTRADTPDGIYGFIALDWDDGHLIGIEILDARSVATCGGSLVAAT
jgi:uncharacterized protein YuzE